MRIIYGSSGGIHLKTLAGDLTRPTSERMKQAVFSMLQSVGKPCSFLDLYAGSGQIGLEAASRGANPVYLVESDRRAQTIVRANLMRTGLKAELLPIKALAACRYLRKQGNRFDCIYFDPPWQQTCDQFGSVQEDLLSLLAVDGWLLIEHPKRLIIPYDQAKWQVIRRSHYGSNGLLILSPGTDRD